MAHVPDAPCISVLMPAYNAERHVLQSVQSVLAQTFEDFELLVVDDGSTDRTAEILASIQDRRLRVLRNEPNCGIVGTLNRAMAQARGRYIARIDSDDFCLPTRFAKQARFLDEHPEILLVGTGTFILEHGQMRHDRYRTEADPALVRWRCLVSNPVGHPTMMFRASAVAALGTYLREEFKYAEDFDFTHRLLRLGDVAVLPENLTIYRLHGLNLTRTRRDEMVAKAGAVLARAYAALLGEDCAAEAALAAEHLMAGTPVRSLAVLERLGTLLDRLVTAFLNTQALTEHQRAQVAAHAGALWWGAVQASLRAGVLRPAALGHSRFRLHRESRPPLHRLARSLASGLVRDRLPGLRPGAAIGGDSDPPRLFAVVGAGADESWLDRVQPIFDRFGLRPIYRLDDAAALRAGRYARLHAVLGRHGCAVGLDAHPPGDLVAGVQEILGVSPVTLGPGLGESGSGMVNLGTMDEAVTLVPGDAVPEQVRHISAMAKGGRRVFVLRCTGPGEATLQGIDAVCHFFFEEMGGMPGNPADLVPQPMRERLWPWPDRSNAPALSGAALMPGNH